MGRHMWGLHFSAAGLFGSVRPELAPIPLAVPEVVKVVRWAFQAAKLVVGEEGGQ